jgi:hypothetical protein
MMKNNIGTQISKGNRYPEDYTKEQQELIKEKLNRFLITFGCKHRMRTKLKFKCENCGRKYKTKKEAEDCICEHFEDKIEDE